MIEALIGGAADLLGGLLGNSAQSSANAANIKLQRENQKWMEMMSNTAYRRATADMASAGLNPMLAYTQGGASTPSSSAATVQPEDALSRGVSSAGGKLMQQVGLEQIKANIDLTKANAAKAWTEAGVARDTSGSRVSQAHYDVEHTRKQIEEVISRFQLNDEQRAQINKMLPLIAETEKYRARLTDWQGQSAKQEERLKFYQIPSARAEAEVWEKLGAMGRGANIGANALQQIISIIRSILR